MKIFGSDSEITETYVIGCCRNIIRDKQLISPQGSKEQSLYVLHQRAQVLSIYICVALIYIYLVGM